MASPIITLNNGKPMPQLGLGTWKAKPEEVQKAVEDAISLGYRMIDGAFIYQNEDGVGSAIKKKIDEGLVKREDLFVVSKLWGTFHRPDLVKKAIKKTLADLGLDYLDLYLMHSPCALKEGDSTLPLGEDGKVIPSDVDYIDTWKAMEGLVGEGLTKAIGVSNFNVKQIQRLLKSASIKPAVNQVEVHPYLNNEELKGVCESEGIKITAYSPFGSPDRSWASDKDPKLLEDPTIVEIGKKYGKTGAQVILRWNIDRGIIVIPKSTNKSRLAENLAVFDFKLTQDEVKAINALDRNYRACPWQNVTGHKDYPFAA